MSLLRTTDLAVSAICVEVGFASTATFTRQFREIVGQTPAAFRAGGRTAGRLRPSSPRVFEKAWTRPSAAVSRR